MGTSEYQPTSRRPIADSFRATARGAVRFCVRQGIHPDVISYFSVVAAALAAVFLAGKLASVVAAGWPRILLSPFVVQYARWHGGASFGQGKLAW